jgi:hypothetical protein
MAGQLVLVQFVEVRILLGQLHRLKNGKIIGVNTPLVYDNL